MSGNIQFDAIEQSTGANPDIAQLTSQFAIACKKCGSANVVVDIEHGVDYGGETGYSSGHFSLGCNNCKQNDFHLFL